MKNMAHGQILRVLTLPVVVVFTGALAAGCTRAKAKTAPELPALHMPEPPPRDVEPNEPEPPPPATLPAEPARNATPRPRPPSASPPSRDSRPEPPKPEAAPPAAEPPKPSEEPKPPATTLQTTPPEAESEVERSIRETLNRATNDLNRIDYRVLNPDARTQYDTAKNFLRQADAAIRAKNLVFAKNLAEKAAALAVQLRGK